MGNVAEKTRPNQWGNAGLARQKQARILSCLLATVCRKPDSPVGAGVYGVWVSMAKTYELLYTWPSGFDEHDWHGFCLTRASGAMPGWRGLQVLLLLAEMRRFPLVGGR
jgi:hypothetical protein